MVRLKLKTLVEYSYSRHLQIQAGVPEKGKGQVAAAAHPCHAVAQGRTEIREVPATIGELDALDVAEQRLGRIEFRRVGRQPLDAQPVPLLRQVLAHATAAVGRQPVPEQNDAASTEMALELTEKADERGGGVWARARLEEHPTAPTVPSKRQCRGHRHPLPVPEAMGQDGRFAPRGPRAADDRLRREATFVLEDEPGALAARVFFTAGHRCATHWRIAGSSRSRARRAGRCSDQFSRRRRYQTWPG